MGCVLFVALCCQGLSWPLLLLLCCLLLCALQVLFLKGEADISEMAIEYDNKPVKKYNKALCEDLGIVVPEGYEPLS